MTQFQFSLETLLFIRKQKEQECEISLARAVGKLMKIENQIKQAGERGEKTFLAGGLTLEDLQIRENVWRKSLLDIKKLQETREKAQLEVSKERSLYKKAHADRMALEKLRERRMEEWKKKIKREEIKQLDEAAKGSAARMKLRGGDL